MKRVGLIGARGFTGSELLPMLDRHRGFELVAAGSRKLAGSGVADHFSYDTDLRFEALTPAEVAGREVDAWVLALPNGLSDAYVDVIDPSVAVVDLSADHRFSDDWAYGLVEHGREAIRASKRIANPGCYATGAQVALRPVVDLIAAAPAVFGVSGYSGAGTTPNERNDPDRLEDNLMPYRLVGHGHESEIGHHLGHPVHFMPHVASFFRGISLTIDTSLGREVELDDLVERYRAAAAGETLLVVQHDGYPEVRDAAGKHVVSIGGFSLDAAKTRWVVVATLDNLLKGAATQAMQNLNLVCGFDELEGILAADGSLREEAS